MRHNKHNDNNKDQYGVVFPQHSVKCSIYLIVMAAEQ